jgi:PKD repeat protein
MPNGRGFGSLRAPQVSRGISIGIVVGFLVSSLLAGFAASITPGNAFAIDSASLLASAEASLASGKGPAHGYPTVCSSTSGTSATCSSSATGLSAAPLLSGINTTGGEWVPVNYSRAFTAVAYDARDGYVVAFGGLGPSGPLGDTWKFGHGNWTLLLTATAPSPRWGAAMAYDQASSSIVLFGGRNGTTFFNDTWTFSGGIWTQLTIPSAPSPRAFSGIAYDAFDRYTVLFGGTNATTVSNETWKFHSGAWTKLTTVGSPPALQGSSFAFDNHLGLVVLFGGVGPGGYSSATWLYRTGTWTQDVVVGPSARAYAGMAFDRGHDALVLFGGNHSSTYYGDTWELVGETWSLVTMSGPSARTGASLAFDGLPPDFYVVLWGCFNGAVCAGDTWNFTGSGWHELSPGGHPPALSGAVLVNVPNARYVVLFGGSSPGYSNATWIFRGGSWTLLSLTQAPSPRENAAATYDPTLGGVTLFGGFNGSYLNDTWHFVGGTWSQVTGSPAPPARELAGLAYDETPVDKTVLFGGYNGTAYLGDTWELSGSTWSQVHPTHSPSPRADPAMTYDGPDGYVLLFGGYNVSGIITKVFNDTWDFRGQSPADWTNLTKGPSPSARFGARASFDPFNGYVVLFGGSNFTPNIAFNDTWGFINGNWTKFGPPASPPGRTDAALAYDRGDKYIVQFGGSNKSGVLLSDSWLWVAFSAQATAFPNPTDVGINVSFGVSAVAGVRPYTYSWAFGDGSVSTAPTPVHAYSSSGSFNATVTVTDSRVPTHDTTTTNVTVLVNPRISVSATATPSVAVPGYAIQFNSTKSGGTGPYTYTWVFGDHSNATTENATHAYATTGTFNATVFVNDSVGGSVNQTVTVRIVSGLAAVVSARPVPTDVGVPVTFNSTPIGGLGPYHYAWRFGDGQNASAENTTHAYSAAGSYLVDFWVNDSASHSYMTQFSVTVAPLPSVRVLVHPTLVDIGTAVTFNGTVSNGTAPFTYHWAFGDGSSAATANATHAYASAGTFTAKLVANDSLRQSANATATVTVVAAPTVSGSASPSPSEVGVAVAFSATESGGAPAITFAWVFGDGGHVAVQNPSHTYATAATFTAVVWANDSFGASARSTVTVIVNPRIAATATVSPSTTDVGVAASFVSTASGGVGPISYAWSFGDGTHGTGSSPAHVYATPGTYHVLLWANDSLAASGSAGTNVTVVADPTLVGFSVSPQNVTTGGSVTFSGSVAGGVGPYAFVYSGLPSGCATVNRSSLTCSPSATGTYTVRLTVTDSLGKSANTTVLLGVTSPSSATFLGLPQTEGYLLLLAVVVLVIAAGLLAWALRRRRKGASGQGPPSPSSEEATPSEVPPPAGGGPE